MPELTCAWNQDYRDGSDRSWSQAGGHFHKALRTRQTLGVESSGVANLLGCPAAPQAFVLLASCSAAAGGYLVGSYLVPCSSLHSASTPHLCMPRKCHAGRLQLGPGAVCSEYPKERDLERCRGSTLRHPTA